MRITQPIVRHFDSQLPIPVERKQRTKGRCSTVKIQAELKIQYHSIYEKKPYKKTFLEVFTEKNTCFEPFAIIHFEFSNSAVLLHCEIFRLTRLKQRKHGQHSRFIRWH